jgi:hypothetical protein
MLDTENIFSYITNTFTLNPIKTIKWRKFSVTSEIRKLNPQVNMPGTWSVARVFDLGHDAGTETSPAVE